MAYLNAEPCIDVADWAYVEECPVVFYEDDVPGEWPSIAARPGFSARCCRGSGRH
jgi:hypothetical protein